MSFFAKGFARALQPLVARQRFARQCMAVALLLATIAALGITGSAGWNVNAAIGQPDIPATKPDSDTDFKSIAELLTKSPGDTAVVLFHVEEGARSLRKPEAQQRYDNFVNFMKFVNKQRVRVLALAHMPNGATGIGADYMLPTEVRDVLTDVTPAYAGFRPGRRTDPRINSKFNGKTLLENKLPGVRNIILIAPGKDNLTHVPAFEAVWNRVNVYRNTNLDPRYNEEEDTNFSSKFVDRMDHAKGFDNAAPLKLPTALALDKHLHYVPIGQIEDVLPTLPGANYNGSFAPDGTPFPHEFAPGTRARASLGAFGKLQKYDAQIRLVLADNLQHLTRQEQARDPERFAFSIVPDATVRDFAQHTATLSDAQTIAEVKNKGIAQASSSMPFPDDRGEVALNTGLVELSIEAHGTVAGPLYDVAGLQPRQLGALIVAHPDLAIASALKNGGNPAIAHLHLSACGKRCSPDYVVGSGPDIEIDEVEYAKQLVRWLAGNGVDVDFVTVHNVMISGSGLTADGPMTWFVLRDAEGKTRGWAFESRLLTTTLGYDPITDKFVEDPEFHYLNKVEAVAETALPSSTHADGPRVPPPGGITPDWVADPVAPPIASPGWAHVSASGAVIDVRPAIGVPGRLEASSKFDVDWAALVDVNGKPGTVVTAANLAAIAAGTRRDPGRIVVVDTDPARVEGVRLAVHLAGTSTDLTDWFGKLSANGLDTAGDDLVLMWAKRASQRWNSVPELAADFLVVEAFNALKARAQSGSYSFHGADLTTRDGAAWVNAHLGSEPVVLIWLPSEHLYLARNAMLDPTATRAETLLRFRRNIALLMGPATMLWQQQGNAAMAWDSEQSYRDHFQLRGAAAVDTVVSANQGAVAAQVREDALAGALDEDLARTAANVGEREIVQGVLEERNEGRLHEWWSRAREALGSVASWIRARFTALMQALNLWEGEASQTPAQSRAARTLDAPSTYIEGLQHGTRYVRAARVELASRGLNVDEWVPVLGTVEPVGSTVCAMSGCGFRPGETEYEMRWLHESTGEEMTLRTRDPVFANVREFIDEHVVRVDVEAAGGHVSTMNAAFAVIGLAHILQAQKQLQQGGLPSNLATALQVQMYMGEAMAVAGVAKDVVQIVQLAREGMREAAQVTSALGTTVKIEARLLRTLGTSLDVVAGLASAGMIGVDIYSLLSAKTDVQRAVAGAQLAVDSTSLAVVAGAIVAEVAGAATASSILGAVAVPLAGVGIGIVGLVEAFMAVAQDVDAAAAKFDKFADLYPRTSWRADEDALVATSHPDAPTMRRAYKWDAQSNALHPVHGIAISKVDLRTRDSLGRRMNAFAESYIDRADPTQSGSQSYFGDRPTATGGNVPQGDRNAAPIPILARTGIYPTAHLPLANTDVVETLIVPATPASRFHSYEYQNLPLANERHLKEAGFMGYEVLRRMEQWNDWNAGFFLFDFDLNAISMILRRVHEDWIPTTVDLVLDDDVHTIAWAEFVIPKDTKWSQAQQQAYRDSNRTMRGNMRYRLNPSGRTAPYVLALQDGYGSIELQAAATGKSTTWMLDARHLASPDAISVSVEARQSGSAAQFGVLRISGNDVRIAGVPGATSGAGEGTAEVYVVMPHGIWHVDFAKRELVSKDLLAATDLVHDKRVQDALKRKGFSWRSDGFIELTGSPTRTFPVNGGQVQRYYQSVRDETLVHAIEDFYRDATLVFGDASEALFHDPRGQLFRVPRGTVRPTRAYVIGDEVPHAIKRVDRLDAETLLVLVEYTRKQPAYFTGAAAPDASEGMTIAYRLGAQKAEVIALMGHNRLNAHLEEVDRATPNNVAYGDFMTYLTTLANVSYFPRQIWLTPLVPVPAEWVSVNGQTRVNTLDVSRQYWIRAKDGHLLKPLVVKPSATCHAGTGAIDGFKVRQAVTSAGCAQAHPGDLVMLDTYQGPAAEAGGASTTWRRFRSPSLGAVYGVRAYAPDTTPVQYPRTQLMTVGKAGTAVEGEDANGLVWRQAAEGWQLSGVGATYLTAQPATWFKNLLALVAAQPASTPAASPLPVTGLQDDDGASILAWHLPLSERWTLARPGMRLIDDGSRPPYRATVQDADGALWYSATVPTATFEKMLDGRKLRGKVQLDAVKTPSGLGRPVSLVSRRDAQCEGSMAHYEDGTALCLSATGKPRVLEMAWCPSQASPVRPSGTESDYIQLACKADATHARSGWLAPNGDRIALPKTDALADADAHRLLGFNAQARHAYFFHPGHQILYTTNWTGDLVRRNWVADARVAGDALVMQDSRYGLSPHHIPRIDGLTTLGLSSASHYATHHAIDAAIYLHYPRILVDMGGAPTGKHQRHQLSLLFTDASKLVVQAWPDGWRAHDPDMARQIELRGTGGNKWIYFGDTGKSLDLATVRPVSFVELPKSGFTLPSAEAPFTDRLDVDGDNIADLLWVEHVNGQGRMRWVLRNADGSVNGVQVRSDVAVPWTTDAASYRLFSSAGIALYCVRVTGAAPVVGRAGLNCYAIDGDGVRAAGHQTEAMIAAVPPDPVATAESARYLRLQRVPGEALGELVRFDGTDFQCVRDGTSQACLRTDSLAAANPAQTFLACAATTPTNQAPAWCQRARAAQQQATVIGPWVHSDTALRLNQGDVECMSYDGRNCTWGTTQPDYTRANPLTCGAMHRILWGEPGYGNPAHWCETKRVPLGDVTAVPPPTAGGKPSAQNLRIEGDLRIGNTLRGNYTFSHPGGAREGASQYQWSLIDAVTGEVRPINGAKHRTYTLRPEDAGAQAVRFTIERLVASTGDIAPTSTSITRSGITGNPPEARHLRIEGEAMLGKTLHAVFDPFDVENDPFGGTTYQWCEYPANSETADGCTPWGTSDTYTLTFNSIGKRIGVKVIPRTSSGSPNVGVETLSPKTAVVTAPPPEARHVRIEGQAIAGATLRAAFDPFDALNRPFGGTTYQWCEYPANGNTPNGCAAWSTSDTWIVTAGNVGKRLAVRVIPRVTTGTPNQGAQVESEKTGIVASGSAPQALNVRILGEPMRGLPLKAVFTAFDEHGDAFGGTTYQWCEYPTNSDTPNSCTAWSTSDTYTPTLANVGKRLAVKVIPRTTSGSPSEGPEATSPKTAAVAWAPPIYGRDHILDIPDSGAFVESKITVHDYGTITDHRVKVHITHPNIGDLEVYLVSPQGISQTLHKRTGGSEDNLIKEFKLATIGGEQRGVWTLRIRDAGTGFTGRLESWSMTFQGAAPPEPLPVPTLEGVHHIRFVSMSAPNLDSGCLSAEGNGTGTRPSVVASGRVSCTVPSGSARAHWHVYPVTATNGQVAYVIKSRENGRCLIRGHNGTASNASLHLWPLSADKTHCGFQNADTLIANGQAAWDLDGLHPAVASGIAFRKGAIRLKKPTQAFLALTSGTPSFTNVASVVQQWVLEFHPVAPSAPEVRNLRIEGRAQHGAVLKALFDAFDADNDPFGGTVYAWCWYPLTSDAAVLNCGPWSTSNMQPVSASHIGKRMAVKVIPKTTSGTPNQGAEVLSAKTGEIVDGHVYDNESRLDIPDQGGWVTSQTVVGRPGTGAGRRLRVHIVHPNIGDLEVKLTDPAGKQIIVHNRTGGSEDNLIGNYSIEGLAKEQRNFWTLSIRDSGAGNVGHLASWSLTLP